MSPAFVVTPLLESLNDYGLCMKGQVLGSQIRDSNCPLSCTILEPSLHLTLWENALSKIKTDQMCHKHSSKMLYTPILWHLFLNVGVFAICFILK